MLDPQNPAYAGKVREFDQFTLRRRRSDGDRDRSSQDRETVPARR